jgi:hypothetical protein
MPTVPELKLMAKEKNIVGYSKMKKAELEEALGLESAPVKAAAPRGRPPARAPVAAAASSSPEAAPEPTGPAVDLFEVIEVHENGETFISLIPLAEIEDLEKFKTQMALPISEREIKEKAIEDYVEAILHKASRKIKGNDGSEISLSENIRYSQVVLMWC